MASPKLQITLFHSSLCPRCRYVKKVLEHRAATTSDIEVTLVEALSRPHELLRHKIFMIPTLQTSSGKKLSGIWLSRKKIHRFIAENLPSGEYS